MSLGQDIRREGFLAQLETDGRDITPQGEGSRKPFRALLFTQGVIDPDLPLGSDLREVGFADILTEADPKPKAGDHWQDDQKKKWKVIKREDNPADFVVRYSLMHLIPNTDK